MKRAGVPILRSLNIRCRLNRQADKRGNVGPSLTRRVVINQIINLELIITTSPYAMGCRPAVSIYLAMLR